MEFAKRELQKYGWKEGKGLGRHETGMTQAIVPKLKFDTTGVGHDYSEEFTYNWWENVYDHAAKNVTVIANENGVSVNVCDKDLQVTTKKNHVKKKKKLELVHGRFFKTSTLHADGSISNVAPDIPEEINNTHVASTPMSDEELFRICGGRTAHKAARHGLKLDGKLARIEEQDKQLLERFSRNQKSKMIRLSVSCGSSENSENQCAQKSSSRNCLVPAETDREIVGYEMKQKRKKKKKEKKKYTEEA